MLGAPAKFNFIPEKQLLKSVDPTYKVTIYVKVIVDKETEEIEYANNLIFSKSVINIYDLEHKYIKFFGDREKKTVGWSIIKSSSNLKGIEGIRQIKVNKNGVAVFGIARLLKSIGINLKEKKKDLLVKTYVSPLETHPIHYITL